MTREEELDWLCRLRSEIYVYMPKEWIIPMNNALDMAIKALEQEPKTGHWIGIDEEPHEDYECNRCGYVVSTYTANIEPHTEYKYCPNCGAKMQEVEE